MIEFCNQHGAAAKHNLCDSLLKHDMVSFWKIWNSKFLTSSKSSCCIDNCIDNADVAQRFQVVFNDANTPNNPALHKNYEKAFSDLFHNYDNDVDVDITIADIESAIALLRKGKKKPWLG